MSSLRPRSNTISAIAPSIRKSRSLMTRSLESFKLSGRRTTTKWGSSNGDPTDTGDTDGVMARHLMSANPMFASSNSSRNSGRASRGSGVELVRPVKSLSRLRRNTSVARGHRDVRRSHRAPRDEAAPKQVPEKLQEQSERELSEAMMKAQVWVDKGQLDGAVVEELSQVLAICKARGLMRHDCEVFDDACSMKSKLRAKLITQLRTQATQVTK